MRLKLLPITQNWLQNRVTRDWEVPPPISHKIKDPVLIINLTVLSTNDLMTFDTILLSAFLCENVSKCFNCSFLLKFEFEIKEH